MNTKTGIVVDWHNFNWSFPVVHRNDDNESIRVEQISTTLNAFRSDTGKLYDYLDGFYLYNEIEEPQPALVYDGVGHKIEVTCEKYTSLHEASMAVNGPKVNVILWPFYTNHLACINEKKEFQSLKFLVQGV